MSEIEKKYIEELEKELLLKKKEIKEINKKIRIFEGRITGITLAPYKDCGKEIRKYSKMVAALKVIRNSYLKEYVECKKTIRSLKKTLKAEEKENKTNKVAKNNNEENMTK